MYCVKIILWQASMVSYTDQVAAIAGNYGDLIKGNRKVDARSGIQNAIKLKEKQNIQNRRRYKDIIKR